LNRALPSATPCLAARRISEDLDRRAFRVRMRQAARPRSATTKRGQAIAKVNLRGDGRLGGGDQFCDRRLRRREDARGSRCFRKRHPLALGREFLFPERAELLPDSR